MTDILAIGAAAGALLAINAAHYAYTERERRRFLANLERRRKERLEEARRTCAHWIQWTEPQEPAE
jgi:hypothetical protein